MYLNPTLIYPSAELEKDFPFWSRLHGLWRTLPNFNPYTVSSEPGQDLKGEALQYMAGHEDVGMQERGEASLDDQDNSGGIGLHENGSGQPSDDWPNDLDEGHNNEMVSLGCLISPLI